MTIPAVTVLVSGSGTTLQAILDATEAGELPCRVNRVIADRPGAYALERARNAGVPTAVVDRRMVASREELSQLIDQEIPKETTLVVLAGYLSILTEPLLRRFPRRIINIHPALLPDFGGAGMYGDRVHQAVLAAHFSRTGCTVHFVDAGTDTGEIILRRTIPLLVGDTVESVRSRLQPVEHRAMIDAIAQILVEQGVE